MTPEGKRLDEFLTSAIAQLKTKGALMPEVGGKKLAGDVGSMLSGIRQMVDEAKLGIAAAVTELTTELQTGKQVEKAIRDEAAHVRKAFAEVIGNNPPETETTETKDAG